LSEEGKKRGEEGIQQRRERGDTATPAALGKIDDRFVRTLVFFFLSFFFYLFIYPSLVLLLSAAGGTGVREPLQEDLKPPPPPSPPSLPPENRLGLLFHLITPFCFYHLSFLSPLPLFYGLLF